MSRFWLTLLVCCLLLGCTGYQMAGKWFGPMPIEGAKECRMLLKGDGSFEFMCKDSDGWCGQGRYKVSKDTLRMEFNWVAQRKDVKKSVPDPVELKINGKMNKLSVTMPSGEKVTWLRKM